MSAQRVWSGRSTVKSSRRSATAVRVTGCWLMVATCSEYRIQFQKRCATRSARYRWGLGVVFGPCRDRRGGDSALDRAAERDHVLGLVVRLDRGLIAPALHHNDLVTAVK